MEKYNFYNRYTLEGINHFWSEKRKIESIQFQSSQKSNRKSSQKLVSNSNRFSTENCPSFFLSETISFVVFLVVCYILFTILFVF